MEICSRLNAVPTHDLAEETLGIAQTLTIPVYDALYVALAKKGNSTLYTADTKLNKTANAEITIKLLKPAATR